MAAGVMAAVLLLWGYHGLAQAWCWWHAQPFWHADRFRMELPLIAALLLLCAWPAGRGRATWFLGGLAGAMPLLGAAAAADLCGRAFDRVPTPLDLRQLPELLHVDPWLGAGAVVALFAALSPPFIAFICWCRGRTWGLRLAALGMRLSLAAVLVAAFWSAPARERWLKRAYCHTWSDLHSVKDRGPLTTSFAIAARALEARRRLAALPAGTAGPSFPPPTTDGQRAAIRILLLESFVDPRDLTPSIPGSIHPDMLALLGPGGRFDSCISPVFGGGSAQAEFELLTGAPARAALGPVEYACLGARQVDGLVASAAAAGYRTVLAYGADGVFFNAIAAHGALGFAERHYADRDPLGVKRPEDMFITDADLTTAVLDRLAGAGDQRPVLCLTVGMEGHSLGNGWFPRDAARFPDVVACDPAASGLANLSYWRSQAIAAWFARVERDDPGAVALALADHQPGILGGTLRHQRGSYHVPALMRVGGRRVPVDGRRIWELPWLVWREAAAAGCEPPSHAAALGRYDAIIAGQIAD